MFEVNPRRGGLVSARVDGVFDVHSCVWHEVRPLSSEYGSYKTVKARVYLPGDARVLGVGA